MTVLSRSILQGNPAVAVVLLVVLAAVSALGGKAAKAGVKENLVKLILAALQSTAFLEILASLSANDSANTTWQS